MRETHEEYPGFSGGAFMFSVRRRSIAFSIVLVVLAALSPRLVEVESGPRTVTPNGIGGNGGSETVTIGPSLSLLAQGGPGIFAQSTGGNGGNGGNANGGFGGGNGAGGGTGGLLYLTADDAITTLGSNAFGIVASDARSTRLPVGLVGRSARSVAAMRVSRAGSPANTDRYRVYGYTSR